MKNCILKIVLLCTFFLLFSCENKKTKPETKPNIAGVVLSFDDAYVNEWFDTDQQLKQYSPSFEIIGLCQEQQQNFDFE